MKSSFKLAKEEIDTAFEFFSTDSKTITKSDIIKRLKVMFPKISLDMYRLIVNGGRNHKNDILSMSKDEVIALLGLRDSFDNGADMKLYEKVYEV
jgi:hypothetical protein